MQVCAIVALFAGWVFAGRSWAFVVGLLVVGIGGAVLAERRIVRLARFERAERRHRRRRQAVLNELARLRGTDPGSRPTTS